MNYTREIKSFIFSHYFSDGLRITIGVLLPSLIFVQLDNLAIGITISLGAFCVSIADNPGPVSHKRNGMLFCLIFLVLTSLLTNYINSYPILIGFEILLLCFFYSMFSIYGNRASSIGTAALLIMILSIDHHGNATGIWQQAAYIFSGGLWYFILSLSISQIRPYRLAQQELGECIKEVAKYVRFKADFYDLQSNFDENYKKLVSQQILVHEQQDVVRELLFKSQAMLKDSTNAGRLLIMIFVDIVDLFEQTMATHYDYQTVRTTFGKTQALVEFKNIIVKLSEELDHLAYNITLNIKPNELKDFHLGALKKAIDNVELEYGLNNLLLKKIFINVRNMVNRVIKMYAYFNSKNLSSDNIRSETDLIKFVSHQDFDFKLVKNNLNLDSSMFRHSLRVAIVCFAGYIVSKLLPFGHHSYWILLTILVIMKPGFSLTKERNMHRLVGTLIGGIAGAGILYFIKDQTSLFILLLIFMIGAYSFLRLNYIVSVLFMTPYILILFNFLGANNLNTAGERVLDTVLGSSIAFIASYFFLPSWEYRHLNTFIREVLIANYNYLLTVAEGLVGKPRDITAYKLTRKHVYVSTANIGAAFQRMISEPKSKQRNVNEIQRLIVLNHILSSYLATLIFGINQQDKNSINIEHIKLIRKSLYALNESILHLDESINLNEFRVSDEVKNQLNEEKSYESSLLTEQLKFINKTSEDIQKLCVKL